MEAAAPTPKTITLPYSKVKIRFTEDYDKKKLVNLTRRLVMDDKLAERLRKDPTKELAKLGIIIKDEDRKKISDEDLLAAMGHRAGAATKRFALAGPLVVVLVIVGVINFPEPAY